MNRQMVLLALTSILILLSINVHFITPAKASPTTWTVDDDGPADFSSIQEAINAASEGDTIFVRRGVYYGSVTVNKAVSLIGEENINTIIEGGVVITSDNVTVSQFTITHCTSGIYQHYPVRGCEISTNIFRHCTVAIGLWASSDNIITSNNISKSWVGIYFVGQCHGNLLSGNYIVDNDEMGIWIFRGANNNNNLRNNYIANNREWGILIFDPISSWSIFNYNTIKGNTLVNNGGTAIAIISYLGGQVSGNIVSDNNVVNNSDGIIISVKRWSNNNIFHNNIIDNSNGIIIYGAEEWSNNSIFHNNFINNTHQVPSWGATWHNGYPSGGNYWSNYNGTDVFSGPYQNETGSDGIGDTPYSYDTYPLMNPWTPQNAIEKLIKDVENMNLQQGIDNSLDAKLTAALNALEALNADQRNDAINKLYAFIKEVEVQRGKKLTNEQADYLIAATQEIIDLITD